MYGTTETIEQDAISKQLQEFLQGSPEDPRPIVLFVHNTVKMMKVLNALQINTVHWEHGIFDILYSQRGHKSSSDGTMKHEHSPYEGSKEPNRSRSRSPKHETDDLQQRPRSPISRTGPSNTVYVVDVRQLFQTMKQVSSVVDTVSDNAINLGVHDVPNIDSEDNGHNGANIFVPSRHDMCAGHESR